MKINVVAPLKEDWILTKLAKMLLPISGLKLSESADEKADINYFMNYALYKPVKTKTCAWFTHPEGKRFYDIAKQVDWAICHAERYASELRDMGLRATTITPGIDSIFKPKLVLGVVGRKYPSGRKGDEMIEKLKGHKWIDLKFTHRSWGAEDVPFEKLPDFYNLIDYLLVTSTLEGGPIPVGEAIACGKAVIAPDIGNIDLFRRSVIFYNRGDYESMLSVLEGLMATKEYISTQVENVTWDRYVVAHEIIFKKLWSLKV